MLQARVEAPEPLFRTDRLGRPRPRHPFFSATEDRRKVRNLRRDPRVSVSISGAANPYRHTQVRGTVAITGDPDKSLAKTLSHNYGGEDPSVEGPEVERVIVRMKIERIAGNVR
jgi:PPOX class probable F420-dependent enzyme